MLGVFTSPWSSIELTRNLRYIFILSTNGIWSFSTFVNLLPKLKWITINHSYFKHFANSHIKIFSQFLCSFRQLKSRNISDTLLPEKMSLISCQLHKLEAISYCILYYSNHFLWRFCNSVQEWCFTNLIWSIRLW